MRYMVLHPDIYFLELPARTKRKPTANESSYNSFQFRYKYFSMSPYRNVLIFKETIFLRRLYFRIYSVS